MSQRANTVGELIELLQEFDEDRQVRLHDAGRKVRPNVELYDGMVEL